MTKYLVAICCGLLLLTGTMYADASAEPEASQPAPPAGDDGKSSWTEKVKFYGDLRFRHETMDKEGKDTRHRHRIRARVGLKVDLVDSLNLDFRLASGSDDPLSTNQSLDGAFSSKQINLDLAYFDYHPVQVKGMHVVGGKIKRPFHVPQKTELIWDGDLTPEGMALLFKRKADHVEFFANLAGLWIEERSSDADSGMFGLQGGVTFNIPDTSAYLMGGFSYYDFLHTEGFPLFFDEEEDFGNTVMEDADGNPIYPYDFNLVEAFFEAGAKFNGIPLAFLADYVKNTAADDHDQGWLIGFKIGKAKALGTVEGYYNYRDLEADAVVGAFADSDFGGGGTDVKGHELGAGIGLAKNIKANLTYFNNTLQPGSDNELDYQRFQGDLVFKF